MGVSHAAKRMTSSPPMGSTTPESEPMRKERHGLPRCLVVGGSYLAQMVHAAVDIAVPMAVRLGDSVHHNLRLLARCRIIKID